MWWFRKKEIHKDLEKAEEDEGGEMIQIVVNDDASKIGKINTPPLKTEEEEMEILEFFYPSLLPLPLMNALDFLRSRKLVDDIINTQSILDCIEKGDLNDVKLIFSICDFKLLLPHPQRIIYSCENVKMASFLKSKYEIPNY